MQSNTRTLLVRGLAIPMLCLIADIGQAAVDRIEPNRFDRHQMDCNEPIRLTRDCSVRDGATRPIALGNYRMDIAADTQGRTILIDKVRAAPNHNGRLFQDRRDAHEVAIDAIRRLRRLLLREGICLERWRPVSRAGRIEGYLLSFSDEVYSILQRHTVLESEHWLPPSRLSRR